MDLIILDTPIYYYILNLENIILYDQTINYNQYLINIITNIIDISLIMQIQANDYKPNKQSFNIKYNIVTYLKLDDYINDLLNIYNYTDIDVNTKVYINKYTYSAKNIKLQIKYHNLSEMINYDSELYDLILIERPLDGCYMNWFKINCIMTQQLIDYLDIKIPNDDYCLDSIQLIFNNYWFLFYDHRIVLKFN